MFCGDSITTTTEGFFDLKNNFCNFVIGSDKWHRFTLANLMWRRAALTSTTTCKHWWWSIQALMVVHMWVEDFSWMTTLADLASFQAVFNLQNHPIQSFISYYTYILLHNSTIDLYRREERMQCPFGLPLLFEIPSSQVLSNLEEFS
jgi:hypothetical protein